MLLFRLEVVSGGFGLVGSAGGLFELAEFPLNDLDFLLLVVVVAVCAIPFGLSCLKLIVNC